VSGWDQPLNIHLIRMPLPEYHSQLTLECSHAKAPSQENYFFPDFNSASLALNCGKS
jgi:hypothetical protein